MSILTVIALGKGIYDFMHNKTLEKNALKQGRQSYNDYYSSPQVQAQYAYIRDYWNQHGLQAKAEALGRPNMLEELLQPAPFHEDNPAYKNAGAGGALANNVLNALAQQYEANKNKKTTASGSIGTRVSGDLYGTGGTMASPGSTGLFSGGVGSYPPGTAVGGAGFAGSSAGRSDATANDPQAILESIFGQGEAPPAVNDPAHPWNDPLRRFFYPGQPSRTQGLGT